MSNISGVKDWVAMITTKINKWLHDRTLMALWAACGWIVSNSWSSYSYLEHEKNVLQHEKYVEVVRQQDVEDKKLERLENKRQAACNAVLSAVTDLREVVYEIREQCEAYPKKMNEEAFLLESKFLLKKREVELMKALGLAVFSFSEKINEEVIKFNNWQHSFNAADICSGKAPSDDEYEAKGNKVLKMMQEASELTEQRIK